MYLCLLVYFIFFTTCSYKIANILKFYPGSILWITTQRNFYFSQMYHSVIHLANSCHTTIIFLFFSHWVHWIHSVFLSLSTFCFSLIEYIEYQQVLKRTLVELMNKVRWINFSCQLQNFHFNLSPLNSFHGKPVSLICYWRSHQFYSESIT